MQVRQRSEYAVQGRQREGVETRAPGVVGRPQGQLLQRVACARTRLQKGEKVVVRRRQHVRALTMGRLQAVEADLAEETSRRGVQPGAADERAGGERGLVFVQVDEDLGDDVVEEP